MQRLTLIIATAVLTAVVAVPSSHATIILQDDFNGTTGTTVDSTKWNTTTVSPPLLDGSGRAVVDPTSGSQELLAKSSFFEAPTPTTGNEIKLTFVLPGDFTNIGRFGLTDGAGHGVDMSTEIAANQIWFHVASMDGGNYYYYFPPSGLPTAGTAGTWLFDWTPSRIVVSKNGSTLIDTGVTDSDNPYADTPFNTLIPTVPMGPFVVKDHSDSWPATALVDSVLFEDSAVIPEPSTILLLGLGGLTLWRWKKQV